METLWQDVRYGWRVLLQKPVFALVAVLTLALGIGANTAIFSVVNAALLRPLPYPDPDQIVVANIKTPQVPRDWAAYPDYLDYRRESRLFEHLSLWSAQSVNLTGVDEPSRVVASFVTANFFEMLGGVKPAHGRFFLPGEDEPGKPGVVVLSHSVWQSRFGGDQKIVGKSLILNNEPCTVIGILPADARFAFMDTDVYLPITKYPNFTLTRDRNSGGIIGRMKTGVRIEQAQAEMAAIAQQLAQQYLDTNKDRTVALMPLHELIVEDVRTSVLVLLGAVGFVLLIACANVANLLLARAASRKKEIAMRAALGASRLRLVRQMLTETMLLWLAGGVLGLLIGQWSVAALVAISPIDLSIGGELQMDAMVLGFTFLVATLTGVLFGLMPALHFSKPDVNETLKEGARGVAHGSSRARSVLVAAQLALALVLLIGSGLMVKSLLRVMSVDVGFQPEKLLTMEYRVPRNRYPEPHQQWNFHRTVVERVQAVPGVRAAAVMLALPFSGNGFVDAFVPLDRPQPASGQEPRALINRAHPDTFRTMGIPLVRGRGIEERDTPAAPRVVVVNQRLAEQFWPNEDPIGKTIKHVQSGETATIVGVVGNIRHFRIDEATAMQMYLAFAQMPHIFATLAVRTEGDPMVLSKTVREAVWSVDKDQPVWKVRSMESLVERSYGYRRFILTLLGTYASLALLLAAVGIYGVVSYMVGQRTQEIGIRVALGAQSRDILRLVLTNGALLTAAGLVVGTGAAVGLTRFLSTLVFQVKATDAATFAGAAAVLALVALVACYIPARRAMRVDPVIALRYE
jgi:putative ABC transport system permease protein